MGDLTVELGLFIFHETLPSKWVVGMYPGQAISVEISRSPRGPWPLCRGGGASYEPSLPADARASCGHQICWHFLVVQYMICNPGAQSLSTAQLVWQFASGSGQVALPRSGRPSATRSQRIRLLRRISGFNARRPCEK